VGADNPGRGQKQLADAVCRLLADQIGLPLEASGRHVHLSETAISALFGPGYTLTPVKKLSQPGQFACRERVTLVGEKGEIPGVAVLGPARRESQVEISLTDARLLGVAPPPVRQSGDLTGTPGILLKNGDRQLRLDRGLMVAQRHIHLTPEEAERQGLCNGQLVRLKALTRRPVVFCDVVVRVSRQSAPAVHMDYDEANACGWQPGDRGVVLT
jgi:propanediol utilization protein